MLAALTPITLGLAALASRPLPVQPQRFAPSSSSSRSGGVAMSTRGFVITGGAGGVGYAYADELMGRGHWVVICDVKDPAPAIAALQAKHGENKLGKVWGTVCDVSSAESVEALGDFAKDKLGTIHYWINNAGINGGRRPFSTLSTGTVSAVVRVNLIGILLCTKVAMEIMQNQDGVTSHVSNRRLTHQQPQHLSFSAPTLTVFCYLLSRLAQIFQTVGSGVKGGGTPGYAAYGATKRGLPQLVDSLVKELDVGVPGFEVDKPKGTVNVHTLSPGMVFTDLLLNDSTPELRKFPFGVLAAQPDEVAEDLVPKILGTSGNGQKVEFLTTDRVLKKFVGKFLFGEKSQYIDDDGNVIKMPGQQYDPNGVAKQY